MHEETGSIGAVGAIGPTDDHASAQDHSPSPPPPAADAATRPSEQAIKSAVDQINAHLARVNRMLSLKLDPRSGYAVAQITDALTGEVLQQIPTEDHIQLERMIMRWSHGGNVLMDEKA